MTDKSKRGVPVDTKINYAASRIFFGRCSLKAVLDADGLARELATAENQVAAKIGGFHFATQFFSEVGGNRVTVVQAVSGDDEFGFGIENDEVGIVPSGETAFVPVAAG
jgi:hypothetical protein